MSCSREGASMSQFGPVKPCICCGVPTRGQMGTVSPNLRLAVSCPLCCECGHDLQAADEALGERLNELGIQIGELDPDEASG